MLQMLILFLQCIITGNRWKKGEINGKVGKYLMA